MLNLVKSVQTKDQNSIRNLFLVISFIMPFVKLCWRPDNLVSLYFFALLDKNMIYRKGREILQDLKLYFLKLWCSLKIVKPFTVF